MPRKLCAIQIAALLAFVGASLPGCSKSDGPDKTAPAKRDYNVLLITLDTTRVDYLSCYDPSKAGLTPNIDAVAADGVRFEFTISQSAGTPMSHASILTGLNPYQHGVRVISAAGGYKLKPGIPTMATVLSENGWHTAAYLSAFTVSEYYDFNRGFDTFDNGLTQSVDSIIIENQGGRMKWEQDKHQRRSDVTVERALGWLRAPRQKPFFLWIHFWDPHDRMIMPPEELVKSFVKPGMSPDEVKRAIYSAEVNFVDEQVGKLLALLRESAQYDNTLIAIVADHGQGLGQHGWWSHRLEYQEDIHVPLILRGPEWPHGRLVGELTRTIDILPTILETLGITPPDKLEGESLVGLMEGRAEAPRMAYSDQIIEYDVVGFNIAQQRPKDNLSYVAMDRTWKLLYRYTYPQESELFNLIDDPHELKNIAAQHPDQFQRLKKYLDECDGYVTRPFTEEALPDKAIIKSLSALGYVGDVSEDDESAEDAEADSAHSAPASQPASAPASQPASAPADLEES